MALTAWGKKDREDLKISELKNESLSQENQLLKLQLMIAGKGGSPGQPYDDPEKGKGPFVPPPGKGLMISHGEGRGPQPKYHDEYNRELPIPPWMQMFPDGKLREIPWMKEQYLKEHPQANLQISNINYPPPSELDKWLQLYQRNGGSLRHLDPDLRRLILQRGAMKAQGGRGHTTVGDKLYLDPIKQKLMPLPIDLESDKDKEIRHNLRFKA